MLAVAELLPGLMSSVRSWALFEVEYDQYRHQRHLCDNCNDPGNHHRIPLVERLLGCWLGGGLSGGVGLMLRVRS